MTASLAGRGSWCLSAGAQITPAATANEGAKTMKRTAARWYPVLLLRNPGSPCQTTPNYDRSISAQPQVSGTVNH